MQNLKRMNRDLIWWKRKAEVVCGVYKNSANGLKTTVWVKLTATD
jgi:hypothetical protein